MEGNTISRRAIIKTLSLSGLSYAGLGFAQEIPADSGSEKAAARHYDVIVVGGGPGGVSAAVSAARNGARVLLIERYGFLGGMATSAQVVTFMKYISGDTIVNRGLFEEFLDLMEHHGAIRKLLVSQEEFFEFTGIISDLNERAHFDDEVMKYLLDRFVLDAGVELLLHTQAIGIVKKGTNIVAVKVAHKGGTELFSGDIIIDASGDGDIAAWAGAEVEIGSAEDHACQPMTTSFRMANIDMGSIPDAKTINHHYDNAKRTGEVKNPRHNVLKHYTVHTGELYFNTTRVIGKNSLDPWSFTEAEIEGRRQVQDMVGFLKKIKGFEDAYLSKTGIQIGVRETRRIIGQYILTEEDVLKAHHFDDGVACGCYSIDIHNPKGEGIVIQRLEEGTWYNIPYRCLTPRGLTNCLISSRCISATHEANGSLRVMPIVWSIGQAAGLAASICIKKRIKPDEVDVNELRTLLKNQGAFVG